MLDRKGGQYEMSHFFGNHGVHLCNKLCQYSGEGCEMKAQETKKEDDMFRPGLREWFSSKFSFRHPEKRALSILMLSWATATALILMVDLGEAARGEICYSTPVLASQATPVMNTTTFTCPTLGAVTIPQIYQFGWRVTQLSL
jgi:hypothetical protein